LIWVKKRAGAGLAASRCSDLLSFALGAIHLRGGYFPNFELSGDCIGYWSPF
jgi:hypothetical protein